MTNTLFKTGIIAAFTAIALAIFTGIYLVSENRAKGNKEYGKGLVIDLPEEIGVIGKKIEEMQAYRSNDTLYIQFK